MNDFETRAPSDFEDDFDDLPTGEWDIDTEDYWDAYAPEELLPEAELPAYFAEFGGES